MSTATTNYGLVKPELTDPADITATNTNWDKIDSELKDRAKAEHFHEAADLPVVPIEKGGTGATSAANALKNLGINATADEINYIDGATSNIQEQLNDLADDIKSSSVQVASATSSDGVAYTATVENISNLYAGLAVFFIPDKTSASTAPTFNLNALGAKTIRRKLSMGTSTTSTGSTNAWLYVGKPYLLVYDGTYWIVENLPKPCSTDLYGLVSVDKGGTGASDAATARNNLGAVSKSGDTMTGGLSAPQFTVDKAAGSYTLMMLNSNGELAGYLMQNPNDNTLSFKALSTDGSNIENYIFPTPDGESGEQYYWILTTKKAVTVAQGGTGAITAADACTNLGAVKKSGDTMTGGLTTTAVNIIPGHIYPQVQLRETAGGSYVSYGAAMDDAFIAQVVYEGTDGNREYYMLPKYTVGRTSSDWYSIITSKDTKPTLSSTTAVDRTQYFNVGDALIQSGVTPEVSCANNTVTSYTVTFPKSFSSGCTVIASLYYNNTTSAQAAAVNVAVGSYSNSSMTILFSNTSGDARKLRASWIAMGQ